MSLLQRVNVGTVVMLSISIKQAKDTAKLLTEMNKHIDQVCRQIDNTQNTISVKEQLEDIKDILRNME